MQIFREAAEVVGPKLLPEGVPMHLVGWLSLRVRYFKPAGVAIWELALAQCNVLRLKGSIRIRSPAAKSATETKGLMGLSEERLGYARA